MNMREYRHKITIPFHDIDAAGIVFFAHLFRYAHEAYEHFMSAIGHSLADVINEGNYLLPLVHAEADYKKPLHHNETVTIELVVKKLGDTSYILHYRFLAADDQLRAEVETVHVTLDAKNHQPVSIPDSLRRALSED